MYDEVNQVYLNISDINEMIEYPNWDVDINGADLKELAKQPVWGIATTLGKLEGFLSEEEIDSIIDKLNLLFESYKYGRISTEEHDICVAEFQIKYGYQIKNHTYETEIVIMKKKDIREALGVNVNAHVVTVAPHNDLIDPTDLIYTGRHPNVMFETFFQKGLDPLDYYKAGDLGIDLEKYSDDNILKFTIQNANEKEEKINNFIIKVNNIFSNICDDEGYLIIPKLFSLYNNQLWGDEYNFTVAAVPEFFNILAKVRRGDRLYDRIFDVIKERYKAEFDREISYIWITNNKYINVVAVRPIEENLFK